MEQLQQFWYSVGAYMMFLIALVSVVWVFFDSIRKNYNAVVWQGLTSLAVIVILPSVVFAALPTLQASYTAFIGPLFWVGLLAGVISIVALMLYLFRMGVSDQFQAYNTGPVTPLPPSGPTYSDPPPARTTFEPPPGPPTSLPGVIKPTAPNTQRTVTQSNRGYTTTLPAGGADNFSTAPFSSGPSTQPTAGLTPPSAQPTMRLDAPPTSTERTPLRSEPLRSLPQSPPESSPFHSAPTQAESQTPTMRLDSNLTAPGVMSDPPPVSMTDRTVSIGAAPPSHTDPMIDIRTARPSETDRTIDMRAMSPSEMERMNEMRFAPPSETDRTISMSPTATPSSPFAEPMPMINRDKMSSAPASSGGGETRIFGQTPTQWAYLVIREGVHRGKTFSLGSVVNIGRRADVNDVVLDDDSISREHARIRFVEGQFILTDLVSSNGTFVQEHATGEWKQIHTAELSDKLNLKLGEMMLTFFQVRK